MVPRRWRPWRLATSTLDSGCPVIALPSRLSGHQLGGVVVQAAFGLVGAGPAAGAAVVARADVRHGDGAVGTAEGGVAALVELVVGHVVRAHVVPDAGPVPPGQRVHLDQLIDIVPLQLTETRSLAALRAHEAGDP